MPPSDEVPDDQHPSSDADRGYAIAQERIAEALLEHKTTLDLSGLQLRNLPDELASLSGQLVTLDLNFNQLTSTTELAQALAPLTGLSELWLQANQLTSTTELAQALAPLTGLSELRLNSNQLTSTTELAQALAPLTGLSKLRLNSNQLTSTTELAQALAPLTGLSELWLSSNQLTSTTELAQALAPLTGLSVLNLGSNELTSTSELAQALAPLTGLSELRLSGNDIAIPDEVLGRNEAVRILRALQLIVSGESRSSPEFKIVILGEGRIGKTQLRHRLMGEKALDDEEPTHSFEWCVLPWPCAHPQLGLSATLHLFDFGGQTRLMASHRFFLSHRRTFYVICVDATDKIAKTRLPYWLSFVHHLWEEGTRADARRECDLARGHENDQRAFHEALERRRSAFPRPPIVVVVTRSCDAKRKTLLDIKAVRDLCNNHQATLVEDYDSFDPAHPDETRVQRVKDKITDATRDPSLRYVWTDQFANRSLDLRTKLRAAVGFDQTGLNPNPAIKHLSVEDYLANYAQIGADVPPRDERRLFAMDSLTDVRDLGVVHWLGDRTDLSDSEERLRKVIFSPAWVRGPIYRVLWAADPVATPLNRDRLETLLRGDKLTGDPQLSQEEVTDLIALMCKCELIFESRDNTGARFYFVPDRLPPGDESPLIANDGDLAVGEHGYRLDLGFVPDALMPRLIGKFSKRHKCESLTRCSTIMTWAEPGLSPVTVKVSARQAEGVVRVAIAGAEPRQREAILAALRTMIQDTLDRPMLPDFEHQTRDQTTRRAKIDDRLTQLRKTLPSFIQLLNDNVDKSQGQMASVAQDLGTWLKCVNDTIHNEMPYRMAVLAGLARASKGNEICVANATAVSLCAEQLAILLRVREKQAAMQPWADVLIDSAKPKRADALRKALSTAIKELRNAKTRHPWLLESGKSAEQGDRDDKAARQQFNVENHEHQQSRKKRSF